MNKHAVQKVSAVIKLVCPKCGAIMYREVARETVTEQKEKCFCSSDMKKHTISYIN